MGDFQLNATLRAFENYSTGNCNYESLPGKIAEAKVKKTGNAKGTGAVNIAPVTGEDGAAPQNIQRNPKMKPNNSVRKDFFEAVAQQFGGADKIPQRVIEEMKLEDYGGLKKAEDGQGVVVGKHSFTSNKKLSDTRVKAVLDAVQIELTQKRGEAALGRLFEKLGQSVGKTDIKRVLVKFLAENLVPAGDKVEVKKWLNGSGTMDQVVDALRKACGASDSLLLGDEDQKAGTLPVDNPVKKVDFMCALEQLSNVTQNYFRFRESGAGPNREERCDLAMKSFLDKAKADLKWSPVDTGEALKRQYAKQRTDEDRADFLFQKLFRQPFHGQYAEDAIDAKLCKTLLKSVKDKMPELVGFLKDPNLKDRAVEFLKARFRECAGLALAEPDRGKVEDNFNCFMDRTFGPEHVISDSRMNLFKSIAALARGKDEGTDGGAGYMGYIAGKPVKFLTHALERFGSISSGLTPEQIALVNQSTVALVKKLKILASFSNHKIQDEVNKLLQPHAGMVGTGKLIPPLPRTTVAKIVSLIAQEVRDSHGEGLHWADVRHAPTQDDTKIATVFTNDMLDLEPGARMAIEGKMTQNRFFEFAENEDYRKQVAEEWEDYEFVANVDKIATPKKKPTAAVKQKVAAIKKKMKEQGFVNKDGGNLLVFNGYSQKAALKYESLFPGMGNYALQTYADGTFPGGTFNGGQEESLFGDSDPAPYAAMIEKGFVKHVYVPDNFSRPTQRLEYDREYIGDFENRRPTRPKASPVSGVLLKHDLYVSPPAAPKEANVNKGNKAGKEEKVDLSKTVLNATRLLASWPSFRTTHLSSDDIFGSAGWAIKCAENLEGRTVTDTEANNVFQFFIELIRGTSNKDKSAKGFEKPSVGDGTRLGGSGTDKPTRARDAMMIAMFLAGMKDSPIDVFGNDPKGEVGKLLDLIEKGDYKALFDEARQNYIETSKAVLRKQLDALLAKGIHVLFGGPIGCGFFQNMPGDVAKVFNEVLAEEPYRDSILYVYCKGDEDKVNYKVFKDEFNSGANVGGKTSGLLDENNASAKVNVNSGANVGVKASRLLDENDAPAEVKGSASSRTVRKPDVERTKLPEAIENLINEKFSGASPLYKDILREIAAKDLNHAQDILTKLSKVNEPVNFAAEILLNQPDTDTRLKLLDWLEQFDYSDSENLLRALSSRRTELLHAEEAKRGQLTRKEILTILFPDGKVEIEANAKVIQEEPKRCLDEVFTALSLRIANINLARSSNKSVAFLNYGRMLMLGGIPLTEVLEMMDGKRVPEPAKWDQAFFLSCVTGRDKGLDGVAGLFARDLWGQRPTLSMSVQPTGLDKHSEKKTWDANALAEAGALKSPDRSSTSDAIFGEILVLCEKNELQAMSVALALTQANNMEAYFRAMMLPDVSISLQGCYQFDIVKDPATGDVTVTKASKPGAPIASSVTRIFHPDGTMTVVPPENPQLNKEV